MTKVINVKTVPRGTEYVYIGRRDGGLHFGNPYSHLPLHLTKASFKVDTREEAVENYRRWLKGEINQDHDQVRKEWILQRLPELKDKVLGCYCAPLLCHGDVLKELIDEIETSNSAVE